MSLYLFHSIWTLIGNRRLQLPKMLCPAWFILSSPKVIVPAALFTTDSIPCLFCAVRHEIPTTKLLGFMGHSEGQTPQLAPGWSGLCLYKSLGLREWYWTVLGLHLVFDPLEKKTRSPRTTNMFHQIAEIKLKSHGHSTRPNERPKCWGRSSKQVVDVALPGLFTRR